MTRTRPVYSFADLRAERHAQTFTERQLPPVDPRVRALLDDEGYLRSRSQECCGCPCWMSG